METAARRRLFGRYSLRQCRSAVTLADDIFSVADFFLHFAFDLFIQAFGLLLAAANGFADTFLNLAANVFGLAFDLVLIHMDTSFQLVNEPSTRCASHPVDRRDWWRCRDP